MKKARNGSLSILKCVSIYAVILAHIPLPGWWGRFLCALAKFSVPVFFLSSGYFSYGKDAASLKRSALRTWSLLGKVSLFHLLLGCALAVLGGDSLRSYLLSRLHPLYVKELLLYQMLPLPHSWHLWFLLSLAVTYTLWLALILLLEKRHRPLPYTALGVLSAILLGINIALGEGRALAGLSPLPNYMLRNAWLDALPFFALGALLREKESSLSHLPLPALYLGAAGCVGLNLWEYSRVDVVDVFLGTTLLGLLLMVIVIRRPHPPEHPLTRFCRYCGDRLTFYIYVIHVPLYSLLGTCGVPFLETLMGLPWVRTLTVSLLSTLLAAAFDCWSRRRAEKRRHIL